MRAWEMLEYAGLSSRHADRQRLAVCHAKLDDVGAVAFRTVDHDAVLAARRSDAHLRSSFDQSFSASRFTAGASDDVAEVPGLGFPGAWVKHSPPKRLRNASAVAVSGKQNRIWNCSASCRLRPRRTGMRRSRWNASISRKTLRKPPGVSARSTRCGKSRSFVRPTISRLRRVISPNPLRLSASLLGDRHPDPVIREKSQFRAQHDSLSLSPARDGTSLCLNFRPLAALFFWAAFF